MVYLLTPTYLGVPRNTLPTEIPVKLYITKTSLKKDSNVKITFNFLFKCFVQNHFALELIESKCKWYI